MSKLACRLKKILKSIYNTPAAAEAGIYPPLLNVGDVDKKIVKIFLNEKYKKYFKTMFFLGGGRVAIEL